MKLSEAVSKLAEEYVDTAEHEGGDALVTTPSVMRETFEDFSLYLKYSVDANVHDDLTPDSVGTDRLHVLTEEEYCTVFDFINEWGPSYLEGLIEPMDFDSDQEAEDFDAMMEALRKLLKRMVDDRTNGQEAHPNGD